MSLYFDLYHYKRLSFGINASAEVFQPAIQLVIQDATGSLIISDDIVVFRTDIESHDKAVLWYDLFGRWRLPRSEEGGGSEEITGIKECV